MKREEIAGIVSEVIATILPIVSVKEIPGDKHLKDLGADSIDRVEIILSLINRLGIDEPMSGFSDLPNINALVDYLHQKQRH